jgi:hypothetical protein
LGISAIPTGFILSIWFAYLIRKKSWYKPLTYVCLGLILIGKSCFYFTLDSGNFWLVLANSSITGGGQIALFPIILEWAQEISFPAPEP